MVIQPSGLSLESIYRQARHREPVNAVGGEGEAGHVQQSRLAEDVEPH